MKTVHGRWRKSVGGFAVGLCASLLSVQVNAALTIPDVPLQGSAKVPPNLMLILDNSSSMTADYMPDVLPRTKPLDISRRTMTRNLIYYDPSQTYLPWKNWDGSRMPVLPHTAVNTDANLMSGNTTSLNGNTGSVFYLLKSAGLDPADSRNYYRYRIANNLVMRSELVDMKVAYQTDVPTIAPKSWSTGVPNVIEVTLPANTIYSAEVVHQGSGTSLGNVDLYGVDSTNSQAGNLTSTPTDTMPSTWYPECYSKTDNNNENCASEGRTSQRTVRFRLFNNGTVASTPVTATLTTARWANEVAAVPTWQEKDSTGTIVTRSRTQADEVQNIATWFSYHRTRAKIAKAGASDAFADLGEEYRVGFDPINHDATSDASDLTAAPLFPIPVSSDDGRFKNSNRQNWYTKLHEQPMITGTPLRLALSRTGNYFKTDDAPWTKNGSGQLLSCQRNYAILTTDGYWWDPIPATLNINEDGTASTNYTPTAPFKDTWTGTLADMAMRLWKNDLRPDLPDTLASNSANPANWQHMVTFGISIGERGTLDPADGLPASWPNPFAGNPQKIDDLWHAAVNGRGRFVPATDAKAFADALRTAFEDIREPAGSRTSLVASSGTALLGSSVFMASYDGDGWMGDIAAHSIVNTTVNGRTVRGLSATPAWRASQKLPAHGSRTIFTETATGGAGTTFPTAAQTLALTADVTNYLRGDSSKEVRNGGLLRNRSSVLGDIIHSQPVVVKGDGSGTDKGNTIFAGANDGMLHAFNADTGVERFAYVPGGLDLARLATYSSSDYQHRFFVDGPLVTSPDAQSPSRRFLVGSLGRGGKGMYALDITDPVNPAASNLLWDNTWTSATATTVWSAADQADTGLMIGKPIIAKLNDSSTLRVVTGNGINSASGKGAVFVINIETGAVVKKISVPGADNGILSIRGLDVDDNGSMDFLFAGDLLGNLWKIDLSSGTASSWDIAYGPAGARIPLIKAVGPSGTAQPITGGIGLSYNPATFQMWVFFGTGRLLQGTDLNDKSVQSVYGVMDGAATARANLQQRSIVASGKGTDAKTTVRAFEPFAQLPAGKRGWVIDLLDPLLGAQGERITTAVEVVDGRLELSSQIPGGAECAALGSGYIYFLNAFTGTSLATSWFDIDRDGSREDETLTHNGKDVPVGGKLIETGMLNDLVDLGSIILYSDERGGSGKEEGWPSTTSGRISWRELTGNTQ